MLTLTVCGGATDEGLARSPDVVPTMDPLTALAAGDRFLDDYVDSDGRVVRHDQGGDTVSEGQAYGMLVAVALEKRERFDAIWAWTQKHLQRDDGLLAWRWAGGSILDQAPATDADVDAAHALALAATVFGDDRYLEHARHLAAAILTHEVVEARYGRVAVAGPWAVSEQWVNPSYGAPVAFDRLAAVTGDAAWDQLDDGARRVLEGSTTASDLPPDWARLTGDAVEPSGPPSGGDPRHSYDAARTAVRFAIDCDAHGRSLAAAMDDEYDGAALDDGAPAAVLSLEGRPLEAHGHPVMSVGAAAAALAAGDREDAARLLTIAERQDRENPTYYGAAWVALGRLWLSSDELGGCSPN